MDLKQITHADNVRLSDDGRAVRILDQSRLPNETVYLELSSPEALYEAIASLRVRGAPAIGIFAGYALYVLALQSRETQVGPFVAECRKHRDYLNASRPTAVNLRWALERMEGAVKELDTVDGIRAKGARPQENGTTSQGAFIVKDDVSKLSKRDRAEIIRRAARGEHIEF